MPRLACPPGAPGFPAPFLAPAGPSLPPPPLPSPPPLPLPSPSSLALRRFALHPSVLLCCSYGLLGSSGCGKSTILKAIVGQHRFTSGEVRVLGSVPGSPGAEIPGPAIGYMPQVRRTARQTDARTGGRTDRADKQRVHVIPRHDTRPVQPYRRAQRMTTTTRFQSFPTDFPLPLPLPGLATNLP